ncbi:hypothetical protein [Actinomadura sp. 6N118]|uniref:hypothetical protein n=1 Tax=Actinomadura sp. 6N118 TaxID=3375151 RepID=UPI00378C4A22
MPHPDITTADVPELLSHWWFAYAQGGDEVTNWQRAHRLTSPYPMPTRSPASRGGEPSIGAVLSLGSLLVTRRLAGRSCHR